MKYEFFIKIIKNEPNYNDNEASYINRLVEDNILKKKDGALILNSIYRVGKIIFKQKGARFIDSSENEHKDMNIDFEDLNGAHDGDFVLIKRVINPKVKSKAKVVEVLRDSGNEKLVYKKDKQLFTIKENIVINFKLDLSKYEDGDILKISNKKNAKVELVGNINDPKIDELLALIPQDENYRLEKYFCDEVFSMDDKSQRVDLTDLPFCTIDPASAKDHDDAIYFDKQNSILYVAIADVSYFVKEGTLLDFESFKRASSLYFPNRVLPMLPFELSEELCSLKPDVKRYAYVFKIFIDKDRLEVTKSELFEATIISKKKYSYGRIDRVIEGYYDTHTPQDKEIFDYLIPFYSLSKSLREKRMLNGYEFRTKENRLKLDSTLELNSVECEESTPSHQLIEEAMLLANVEASKKLGGLGIFRVHGEPPYNAIVDLLNEVNLLGINVKLGESIHSTIVEIQKKAKAFNLVNEVDKLIIESQQLAVYSSKNLGHFGLGFKSYSHFTSPIRRYSDLVLHRILKSKKIPKDIDEICEHISTKERVIDNMVYDLVARKYARWAQKNIGIELKAVVTDTTKGIVEVYDNKVLGLRAVCENFKNDKLFSKCKIIIKSSDIVTKVVVASIKY